jgi:Sortase and related acyltransferases
MEDVRIRYAEKKDSTIILSFIKQLAIYERLETAAVATVKDIEQSLFEKKEAEVLLIEENEMPVGFALFFHNYSTFLGKSNIYLEDLYINEKSRGNGYGKMLLQRLAAITLERGCERLDWACLDWNEKSIAFYKSVGAKPLSEWITFRLDKEALEKFGQ